MSGIVGSSHNIRGSGITAKLGTDGQVFTSAGAGVKQTFEAAGGGDTVVLGCCPPLLHQCTKSILICFLFGQTHFEVVSNFLYTVVALGAQKSDCYDHPNMTK